MAEAVVDHPRAFGFELMNEPMTIWRRDAFQTWRAVAEAIVAIIPDASVGEFSFGSRCLSPYQQHVARSACASRWTQDDVTHHALRTNRPNL